MPGDISSREILGESEIVKIVNIDRFRPSLKCDLFIPSHIHSLSLATEYIYNYVVDRFPKDYFRTTYIAGQHPLRDFRKTDTKNLATFENPALSLTYNLQYDFNDNMIDFNLLSTNKYMKKSQWDRSFFKCPHKNLYIGMDLETMLINYNFRFKVDTKAQQIDLYNRLRKVFRLGCTETNDIDCDFHLDRGLMTTIATEAGFAIDSNNGDVIDPWNFTKFLNTYSQMPIMYKLRLVNQRYEHFLRMRNLPVHLDFQNSLDVDDGNQVGMTSGDYNIEFQIEVRFPAPRTFALYNEGHWTSKVEVESDEGIKLFSMKAVDIPEENYKGWAMYGYSNYLADDDEIEVKEIDIKELFKAPVDIKVGASLDDIIQDAVNQYLSPDSFIEVAVYTNDLSIEGSGKLPILMDWVNRKIIMPKDTLNTYFYIAVYIDRSYVNDKVVQITDANNNRIATSARVSDKENEMAVRDCFVQSHNIEEYATPTSNLPKPTKKAKFVVNR